MDERFVVRRINANDPSTSDYPIHVVATTGFNGWEVYGTVFYTGFPVMVVIHDPEGRDQSFEWEHKLLWYQGMEREDEQLLAHFLTFIGEADEEGRFVDHVINHGLRHAFEESLFHGDGHATVAFVQQVAEVMHSAYPDLCPDPRRVGSGW